MRLRVVASCVGKRKVHTVYIQITIHLNVYTVMKTNPLVAGGELGERDGQTRLGGGSSSLSSSSEELSSVRSITSTFLLLLLLVWDELFLCSDRTGRHEPVQKTDRKERTRFISIVEIRFMEYLCLLAFPSVPHTLISISTFGLLIFILTYWDPTDV